MRIGGKDLKSSRQVFYSIEPFWTTWLAAQSLPDGLRKFDRQGRLEHDHRHLRNGVAACDRDTVSSVWVDQRVEAAPSVTDRFQPVGVRALAAAEAKTSGHLREGGIATEIERASSPELVVEH